MHTAPHPLQSGRVFDTPYGHLTTILLKITDDRTTLTHSIASPAGFYQGWTAYPSFEAAQSALAALTQCDAQDISLAIINAARRDDGYPLIDRTPEHANARRASYLPGNFSIQ